MANRVRSQIFGRFRGAALALVFVLVTGSVGYYVISGGRSSVIDCVYMTVITITSIGYGEIVDLDDKPGGRVFTMAIALAGIGTATYLLSSFTAFIIEGDLSETFRRRHMESKARGLRDHYIVCGGGKVGSHIVEELRATRYACVVIDSDPETLAGLRAVFEEGIYLRGDATEDDVLLTAGIANARGLFAATDHDHENLVISLTARQLNPQLQVIARCAEIRNIEKMKAAGANAVISPSFIGGLRMASEMLRPAVVTFLDVMLRDKQDNLRIEEIPVGSGGRTVASLQLGRFENTLLLAIHGVAEWTFNPKPSHIVERGSRLIVMTTPEERIQLVRELAAGA